MACGRMMRNVVAAVCLICLCAGTALAWGEIRYPDRPLNLRKARSASAAWVGMLFPGQKVRIAHEVDGWVAIYEPGETRSSEAAAVGYANIKYLKPRPGKVDIEAWGELMATKTRLNVRAESTIRSEKVSALAPGQRVRVDFPEDDWTMVFVPGATIRSQLNAVGWVKSKYLVPAVGVTPTRQVVAQEDSVQADPAPVVKPASKAASSGRPWGRIVTIPDDVVVRMARSSKSHFVRTLKKGDKVKVDMLRNGWYAVFQPGESLRRENRAIGYAAEHDLEGRPAPVAAAPAKSDGGQTVIPIDRKRFADAKRPDPVADRNVHGFQYKVMETSETRKFGESWTMVKVFVAAKKVPREAGLADLAETLRPGLAKSGRNLAILFYLPGMDFEDIAYGEARFVEKTLTEFRIRKTALFGTDFPLR